MPLTDMMGAMMGIPSGTRLPEPQGRGMPMPSMARIFASPSAVGHETVSLRVSNTGAWTHELVVLPLPPGQSIGQRPVGANGKVDERGSVGDASRTCGAGTGDGIAPGQAGWTTLTLAPDRYELVCNMPDHYASGMYTELDVT